ncbi:nickel-dependent hydrogenase large subunit [Pontibacterium granulatum]|uniref:nickel-dependent hydrogenase large subunit n=1 Tax=Pontibacterium granulatum TaxID=2036029 RepID=UPI002499B232|nr:nickel-dependent hydrogenase large subunit [Pontibacterium granulatum]MDI3323261.1 nickel-dependent hydrogenase large subunit [Pontibacterium granulatum]
MSRILVGPFNRVEGDLEVTLDIDGNQVRSARVNSPLYRGFEQIMLGHDPMDALVYTPRICGICSVSQSVACAQALANLMQLEMPENGQHCTNLVLANENMTDLLTHFYLFFMPDFARPVYAGEDWFEKVEQRFKATKGDAGRVMLPARAEFLHLMGLLAGKWPHTLSLQPGGTTKPVEPQERIRLLTIIAAFRRFLETELFGDDLNVIASLKTVVELEQWRQQKPWYSSDFRTFLHLNESLELHKLGRASDQFLSYGTYPQGGQRVFKSGIYMGGERLPLNSADITEDVSHTWMENGDPPRHPSQGKTIPSLENKEGYSWCKSPRLNHQVVEVGALARQLINGHPLAQDLVTQQGGNVHSRIVARLLELAIIVPQMQEWVKAIDPKAPFCNNAELPNSGSAFGMIEAARGSLGHWLEVKKGKIHNYQIIAPTTWNFSPRDQQAVPGALEQALEGTPVREGESEPVAVQHVVRSFDPCMACTVH